MFNHTVMFWLQSDLSEDDRATFAKEVALLGDSEFVHEFRLGVPANTPRDVVDNSYDFQILCIFKSAEDHDSYQNNDPVHEKFIETCKDMWEDVEIFDSLPYSG